MNILLALLLATSPAAVNVTASEGTVPTTSMPGTYSGASPDRPDAGNTAARMDAPHGATAVDGRRSARYQLPGSPEPSGDVLRVASALIGGTATWYCGGGSPCTRNHSPSELIAAIDPTLGIPKGSDVTVTHGGREVRVRIVDVCACAGRRIIDLSRLAFSRLADPARGVIPVEVTYDEGPRMTLPPTDTLEAP